MRKIINAIRAEIHLSKGQKLAQRQQFDIAEREYKEAIRLRPKYSGAYLHYGLMLCDAGRLDEGVQQIRKAIEMSSENPVYSMFLGRVLYDQANFPNALEVLNSCAKKSPENLFCKNLISIVYLAQGKVDEAMEILSKWGVFPSVETLGRLWMEIERQVIEKTIPPLYLAPPEEIKLRGPFTNWRRKRKAKQFFSDGLELLAEGECEYAAYKFRSALHLAPTIKDGHLMLGSALAELGETHLAEAEFEQIKEDDPNFSKAKYMMDKLKSKSEGEEAMPAPYLAPPKEIEFRGPFANRKRKRKARQSFSYGLELLAKGEYERAACEFRNALHLDPTIKDGHLMFGTTLAELGETDLAEMELEQVQKDDASFWKSQCIMGKLKCKSEMFEESIHFFENALQPKLSRFMKAEINTDIGLAQLRLGNRREASKALGNAAKADIGVALFRIQELIKVASNAKVGSMDGGMTT